MSSQLLEVRKSQRAVRRKAGRSRSSTNANTNPSAAASKAAERQEMLERFFPDQLVWKNLDWVVIGWMALVHVGALFAPFFFTWQAIVVTLALHWLTCSIGICLGYHRCLSHRSFKLAPPARFFAVLSGVLSGEGSPLMWAAVHRLHHARSDQEGDPHSPTEGTIWSHLTWLFIRHDKDFRDRFHKQYVPDLMNDRLLVFFEKTYPLWMFGSAGLFYLIGGWPLLLWGVCARMVFAYHSTWFVNSATHLWGYRNYETTDDSRNLWWVAVLSYGEGWHNNHHAYPRVARAGHRWWEFDPTWLAIKTLRFFGLATDVCDKLPESPSTAKPQPGVATPAKEKSAMVA